MSKLNINTEIETIDWECNININHDVDVQELLGKAVLDINGAGCDCLIGFLYEMHPIQVEAYLIAEYRDGKVFISYELSEDISFEYSKYQLTVVSISNVQTEMELSEER